MSPGGGSAPRRDSGGATKAGGTFATKSTQAPGGARRRRCSATTKAGRPCRAWPLERGGLCRAHHDCAAHTDPVNASYGRWIGPADYVAFFCCCVCNSITGLWYADRLQAAEWRRAER